MIASDPGYVGQVRQEDGRWVVAGALDPDWVRERGGPEAAVRAVLAREGIDGDWTVEEGWRGTPLLTHGRDRVCEDGVFYLGDAAGYVEPFTGEGMGWALLGARHLRPLVRDGAGGWTQDLAERWDRRYRQGVGGRQRTCRRIAWLSRHPRLARSALALLSRAPWLAAPAIRGVAAPPP
jgi:flavin-dependent dehydrogenase